MRVRVRVMRIRRASAADPAAWMSERLAKAWYLSTYIRMVAPELPVPERRKMIREPSSKVRQIPYRARPGLMWRA